MTLSYTLRLLCLIVCSVGLLSIAAELILWALAPLMLRAWSGSSARRQENLLYAVQIVPIVLALAATAIGLVPGYVTHETNVASERVGWLCLALTLAAAAWFGWASYRGVRLLLETFRFTQACRRRGDEVSPVPGGTAIVAMRGSARHRLALVGLLRPLILVSSSLLEPEGGLPPMALEIALEHERSHARRRDNWKMFSLRALPLLNLRLPDGKTWMQHWRNAAEYAADDDAVRGESPRALLLAEALVLLSRNLSTLPLPVLSTTLMCAETDLVTRVERLLGPVPEERPGDWKMLFFSSTLLVAIFALALLLRALADLPEHLLHLG